MNYKKFYMIKNCLFVMNVADSIVCNIYVYNNGICVDFLNRLSANQFLYIQCLDYNKGLIGGFKSYIILENIETDHLLMFANYVERQTFDNFQNQI